MEKMEVDDVVDLSIASGRDASLTITQSTARDLRALTQNSGLTITPAPPPPPSQQQHLGAPAATTSGPVTVGVTTALAGIPGSNGSGTTYTHAAATATSSVAQDNVVGHDANRTRRVLRPRTEPRSYAESPDIVLLPAKINGRQQNGNIDSETDDDDDDEEMPPIYPIKELTPAELWERERGLRKLREELRNEETKLVLLKKLKQSQQMMKENLIVTPTNLPNANNPLASIPAALTKGSLSVTTTTAIPLPAHTKNRSAILRGQPTPGRTTSVLPPPRTAALPGGATLTPGPPHRSSLGHNRSNSNLTITPSVTITPTSAPPAGSKPRNSDRSTPRDDGQTPAQRQAAAKLALRKQLEKTLLQIPPPKPPPPEMHFIPNPSNTEFVYLLGLEHVVDYLTKDKKGSVASQPFRCAQCKIDFTPVWKWEKQGKRGIDATFVTPTSAGKDPKVICEQCVTTNVKKALKAEHTNRLKTAFVKALQQEQEIEQRLSSQSSPSPGGESHTGGSVVNTPVVVPPPPPPGPVPTKSQTPTPAATPTPRPTPTPPSQPTPPPASSSRSSRHDSQSSNTSQFDKFPAAQLGAFSNLANLSNLGNLGLGNLGNLQNLNNLTNNPAGAAAMQALQQQFFRTLQQGLATGNVPSHMMQFTPFLYSYQFLMAQAAQAAAAGKNTSLADIQRAVDLRQFFMDMNSPQPPGPSNNRQNNWKT